MIMVDLYYGAEVCCCEDQGWAGQGSRPRLRAPRKEKLCCAAGTYAVSRCNGGGRGVPAWRRTTVDVHPGLAPIIRTIFC